MKKSRILAMVLALGMVVFTGCSSSTSTPSTTSEQKDKKQQSGGGKGSASGDGTSDAKTDLGSGTSGPQGMGDNVKKPK